MGIQSNLSLQKTENLILKIRNFFVCFLVAFLLTSVISTIITTPNATVTSTGSGYDTVYSIGTTEYKVQDVQNRAFGGLVLKFGYILYGNLMSSIGTSGLLEIDTSAEYWTVIASVYDAVKVAGVGLALLWCLLDLIDKAQVGQVSGEFVLKLGIKFVITSIIINESAAFAEGLIGLGNAVSHDVVGAVTTGGGAGASVSDQLFIDLYSRIKHSNIFLCIGELIELLFPALVMLVCYILMYALLAGRLIEAAIRFAFFPIGVADISSHGLASPGMRYMKKLFAVGLQGAGMYAVVTVGVVIMGMRDSIVGSNALLQATFPAIVGISTVGAMLKVSNIMDDVAGAR